MTEPKSGEKRITAADIRRDLIPSEEHEQRALAQWLDLNRILWCHVPNGGQRSKAVAGKLRAAGVKAGVPDVLIFDRPRCAGAECPAERLAHPPHELEHDPARCRLRPPGVAIELKRRRPAGSRISDSRISDDQVEWILDLSDRGWITRVCYGADEAIALLQSLGFGRART